ncbi:MAG: hypothetical protein K0Q87_4437 [Neobacillus sp.]|jgi:hypothetical protein|nr:hypothetical protein [Neobacillus sp.]
MKGKYVKREKDHDCKHTTKEIGGIQSFISDDIIKGESAKGHLHFLPLMKVYQ